jgi:SAM-dependent methyltransferase
MREFAALVEEAEQAPVGAWDFTWLDRRAVEDRPSWRYFDRVRERVAGASTTTLLEVQAGTGSMIGALPRLPALSVAAEGFPASVAVAGPRLRSRGVQLAVTSQTRPGLPFATGTFDLVISRHPIEVWWDEIARVLRPGGTYFAQHVGPLSLRTLSEALMGPLPPSDRRSPEVERRGAETAGLVVQAMDVERPRTAFYDIGAVVYFLRLVPWIVPGFTVPAYRERLRDLHRHIERHGAFETTAARTLVQVTKPT